VHGLAKNPFPPLPVPVPMLAANWSSWIAFGTAQGPRVPLIIVSPYAKPGYTDTTATTFAGILGYTEHIFGLSPLGANDAAAYPFTNAFDYNQAILKPVRMVHRPLPRPPGASA
jgi:hypothetical protein